MEEKALTEEEKFLISLKRRRRGSLERAIDLYTPYVTVVVYNVIGAVMSKEDVEEVVSDVFISLWKNAGNLDIQKGCIRTYLGAAARNCAKNKLRQVRAYEELDENIVSDGAEPYESIEAKEQRRLLLELINELGEPDSEIFLRYYYYDERISRISAAMGIGSSTIKTKLSRGRKKIKEMLIKRRYCNE
ncbi:MAG: sigma-70 family RNA polymerase sigma factor [bacterium]|nr:sigma-70 family RNA polymerase sigma factor [bacterium]